MNTFLRVAMALFTTTLLWCLAVLAVTVLGTLNDDVRTPDMPVPYALLLSGLSAAAGATGWALSGWAVADRRRR